MLKDAVTSQGIISFQASQSLLEIFFDDKIRITKMLKVIMNESIKTLLLSIKWLLMLSLHITQVYCVNSWFKEKGIIQMFLSLLIILMCWLSKMSLYHVAFNYWYQKTLLYREVYHYKSSYFKTLAKKAFTIGGECNVIVRDSEPIRLLESPRSLR